MMTALPPADTVVAGQRLLMARIVESRRSGEIHHPEMDWP
jgi:hypothetical protein